MTLGEDGRFIVDEANADAHMAYFNDSGSLISLLLSIATIFSSTGNKTTSIPCVDRLHHVAGLYNDEI